MGQGEYCGPLGQGLDQACDTRTQVSLGPFGQKRLQLRRGGVHAALAPLNLFPFKLLCQGRMNLA